MTPLLVLTGCAALIQGGVGATMSTALPVQGNVNLQADAGFSPVEKGDIIENGAVGFGLSARSRVDERGQMNDVGVHLFLVLSDEALRPYVRTTLFSVAQYDTKANLLAPGLGVRLESGVLLCPGDDEAMYCVAAQGNVEYEGWFGGDRPPFWVGGTLGIAVNWNEEL
ncbi:hypothetical protein LBMAG42_05780 [Deltaproteobacteria bacterium]|nr:hypothetical protein LBMAG42_05780 [Deltaproteobacteria bacterium]